jgi:hypothetical protein
VKFVGTVAVLALALAAAIVNARADTEWQFHFRSCTAFKRLAEATNYDFVTLKDVRALQKMIPDLKRCAAFWQCVEDREAGRVKHCFENDKRWR